MVAGGGTNIRDRLPWNWTTLKNMNNQTVAVGLADFMDGSLSAVMSYGPNGVATAASTFWSGMSSTTGDSTGNTNNCTTFTSADGAWGSYRADSGATGGGAYIYNGGWAQCNTAARLLCIETNAAGVDTDPNDVYIQPQVVFTSGGTGSSNTISVTGITDAVTATITPSAGTANIIKDGVSVGGMTTTVGLNSSLVFTLTAPTTLGNKNTATITIGSDTYTWWVGYADAAREARVFITSTNHPGNFGGLAGGDTICNARAAESPLGLGSSWKALLSDATGNAFDRVSWNWKNLKNVNGTVIVDNGIMDLFDGTLDSALNLDERGNVINGAKVYTGTTSIGGYNSGIHTSCSNWTSVGSTYGGCGISNNLNSSWIDMGNCSYNYCSAGYNLYCIEDVDTSTPDTTPNNFNTPYIVQAPVSTRQSSQTMYVGGMTYGATQTMTVASTGGNGRFKVNGGAEVSSGTVRNGDAIVFVMDAPAAGNSSNKMTITAGGMTDYWRVWSGDPTGTVVKRVFVTTYLGSSYRTDIGGVSSVDPVCQSRATSANLGGTWKAIVSGQTEPEWAVNRVGYNWSTLRRLDGVDVVLAGNLWRTDTINLLSSISIAENLTTVSTQWVRTGTNKYGKGYNTGPNAQCINWTSYINGYPPASASIYNGNSGVTSSQWIEDGTYGHDSNYAGCMFLVNLYCIEQ